MIARAHYRLMKGAPGSAVPVSPVLETNEISGQDHREVFQLAKAQLEAQYSQGDHRPVIINLVDDEGLLFPVHGDEILPL